MRRFFEASQKGNKNITNRIPRKEGIQAMSETKKKICVLTAINRQKHSFNKPVGYGKVNKEQVQILQHRINENSILITDGDKSCKILKDIKLKQLKFGKQHGKVYHLNTINSFHSHLKKFMIRFNGVATKYLDYYVSYFQSMKSKIDVFNEVLNSNLQYGIANIRNKRVCFERYVNL